MIMLTIVVDTLDEMQALDLPTGTIYVAQVIGPASLQNAEIMATLGRSAGEAIHRRILKEAVDGGPASGAVGMDDAGAERRE
jgi:hypothetical protein